MNNINTSDVVAEIESARAKRAFNNWINGPDARMEYMTALRVMQDQGPTPGWLRYLMQLSYQNGFKDSQQQGETSGSGDNSRPAAGVYLGTEL